MALESLFLMGAKPLVEDSITDETGDRLHAVLCAAGYNIKWLLRMIAKKGIAFLQRLYLRLCAVAGVSQNGPQVLDAWVVRTLTRPVLPVFCACI